LKYCQLRQTTKLRLTNREFPIDVKVRRMGCPAKEVTRVKKAVLEPFGRQQYAGRGVPKHFDAKT
jgi:hypothetical protein